MTTAYDTVVYPSMVFEQTHPDRLRALAQIHGLAAPEVDTARVLEIAGGDGLNLIALAAAYPGMSCQGFDLAETAVARGQALIAAAGLSNVELQVCDILDARERYPAGSFDYIIAHGVYAWVPEHVRTAIMALIGHALAPEGVAFVSYNAMPGGYVRMMMRDMLLHALEGTEGIDEKIAITHQCLELFSKSHDGDDAVVTALRKQAASMLERPDSVLFHDELGGIFAPQRLTDVVAQAREHGLAFLTDDSGVRINLDGFLPAGITPKGDLDALAVRAAQAADYSTVRFFRQSLFVRSGQQPLRVFDPQMLDGLWMSCSLMKDEDGSYRSGRSTFVLNDEEIAHMIDAVSARTPERFPFAGKVLDADRRQMLLTLFGRGYIRFHHGPAPCSVSAGERPKLSPLVRAMLGDGEKMVPTLDHRLINIEQDELQALLLAADGTRTLAEIAALPGLPFPAEHVGPALDAAAQRALLV
jgi:trans-aconitate methyltransferase